MPASGKAVARVMELCKSKSQQIPWVRINVKRFAIFLTNNMIQTGTRPESQYGDQQTCSEVLDDGSCCRWISNWLYEENVVHASSGPRCLEIAQKFNSVKRRMNCNTLRSQRRIFRSKLKENRWASKAAIIWKTTRGTAMLCVAIRVRAIDIWCLLVRIERTAGEFDTATIEYMRLGMTRRNQRWRNQ